MPLEGAPKKGQKNTPKIAISDPRILLKPFWDTKKARFSGKSRFQSERRGKVPFLISPAKGPFLKRIDSTAKKKYKSDVSPVAFRWRRDCAPLYLLLQPKVALYQKQHLPCLLFKTFKAAGPAGAGLTAWKMAGLVSFFFTKKNLPKSASFKAVRGQKGTETETRIQSPRHFD